MSNKIVTEEPINPPITALPKGAACSEPSPMPMAMGSIPANIATAVIKIGRKREADAKRAALAGFSNNFLR